MSFWSYRRSFSSSSGLALRPLSGASSLNGTQVWQGNTEVSNYIQVLLFGVQCVVCEMCVTNVVFPKEVTERVKELIEVELGKTSGDSPSLSFSRRISSVRFR